MRRRIDDLLAFIRTILSQEVPPWTVWPDPPCGTPDAFFQLCTGLSYEQVWTMIDAVKRRINQ